MGKTAFVLVSDMHEHYQNLANRRNYLAEVDFVKQKLFSIASKYKDTGYHVKLVLLGDIFHRSFKKVNAAVIANNYWVNMKSLFGDIYVVLGNHETTYYKDNPFYTLVESIESVKVRNILSKVWEPVGLKNVFSVPDRIECENVVFHFNHYGCPISTAEKGKVNIGLYHQDIISQDIKDVMKNTYGNDVWTNHLQDFGHMDIFDGFTYNFFGHMHQAYGQFIYTNERNGHSTNLIYLASLGRTSVAEVSDNFLQRNIPAILIEDGNVKLQNNFIMLPTRAECINEETLSLQQEIKQNKIVKEEVLHYEPTMDTPLDELLLQSEGAPNIHRILEELRNQEIPSKSHRLFMQYNQLWKY